MLSGSMPRLSRFGLVFAAARPVDVPVRAEVPCPPLLQRTLPSLQEKNPVDLCQLAGHIALRVDAANACGDAPALRSRSAEGALQGSKCGGARLPIQRLRRPGVAQQCQNRRLLREPVHAAPPDTRQISRAAWPTQYRQQEVWLKLPRGQRQPSRQAWRQRDPAEHQGSTALDASGNPKTSGFKSVPLGRILTFE